MKTRMRVIVNNALSHELDRLVGNNVVSRKVLQKNSILYEIDITENFNLIHNFVMRHRLPARIF